MKEYLLAQSMFQQGVGGVSPHYKARCQELEQLAETCSNALSLVPTDAIRRGYSWLPSEEALRAIEAAKDAASRYLHDHWQGR